MRTAGIWPPLPTFGYDFCSDAHPSTSLQQQRRRAKTGFVCTLAHLLVSTLSASAFTNPVHRRCFESCGDCLPPRSSVSSPVLPPCSGICSGRTSCSIERGCRAVSGAAPDDVGYAGAELDRLSITTFNVLAPIFKRVGSGDDRESQDRNAYLERHGSILRHLKGLGSDVICLQELWVAEQEMVDMYQRSLEGYKMYTLPRTESRGDGVACFVKKGIEVLDKQDLRLKGVGGRVALMLRLLVGGRGEGGLDPPREVVVANTHLLFPHARTFQILRIREVRKLLAFIECYTQANDLGHLPVVLCGDFNGRSAGRVYQHLTERGFRCSYEDTLGPGADCSRWITHLNHRGEELGVDYVWYRNPDSRLGSMEPDWESIVYQSTKQQLLSGYDNSDINKRSLEEEAATAAAEAVDTAQGSPELPTAARVNAKVQPETPKVTTPSVEGTGTEGRALDAAAVGAEGVDARVGGRAVAEKDRLSAALQLLGLSEGFELDEEELKLLLDSSADDFDFMVPTILDGSSTGLEGARGTGSSPLRGASRLDGCRLEPVSSRIWPPSLEQGVWPEDYTMSDHGSLTTSFQVVPPAPPSRASDPATSGSNIDRSASIDGKATGDDAADTAAAAASIGRAGSTGGALEGPDDHTSETRDWGGGDDGHYGLR